MWPKCNNVCMDVCATLRWQGMYGWVCNLKVTRCVWMSVQPEGDKVYGCVCNLKVTRCMDMCATWRWQGVWICVQPEGDKVCVDVCCRPTRCRSTCWLSSLPSSPTCLLVWRPSSWTPMTLPAVTTQGQYHKCTFIHSKGKTSLFVGGLHRGHQRLCLQLQHKVNITNALLSTLKGKTSPFIGAKASLFQVWKVKLRWQWFGDKDSCAKFCVSFYIHVVSDGRRNRIIPVS